MDTLALLCTLHADGPASLQRLRAAELYSIDDVLGCSVEKAADVLGLSMAQARRFHREARLLGMRMHTEGLDREERMFPGPMEMVSAETRPASWMEALTQPADPAPKKEASESGASYGPVAKGEMRSKPDIAAILAPVLKQWEDEDASTDTTNTPQPTVAYSTSEADSEDAYDLDGVDDQLRAALRAAGYATLKALADVEPLELSRATGRTYSEACRVRFLAQRAIDSGTTAQVMVTPPTGAPMTEVSDTATTGMSGASMSTTSDVPMVEYRSSFEGSGILEPHSSETPEEPSGADACARAEAERVLAELAGNVNPEPDRFSPAPPEHQYPQDPPTEKSTEEEGPGGPFA